MGPACLHPLALYLLAGAPGAPAGADRFRESVAPILERHCLSCHDQAVKKGKLSLAARAGALAGGARGPAVLPGKPEESLMLKMVQGERPRMPRDADPLGPEEVAALRRWIAAGAPWPEGLVLRPRAGAAKRAWWSLRPIQRPEVPRSASSWPRTPIDAFILVELEAEGLAPAPEADRRTLIRRLSFDLHGLPPSPEEVAAFLGDSSPGAYDRLVERLLASPRHGERWARHWLDAVHYGETHGYDKDKRRPHAWPYRDYVIRALNDDTPYARFVEEQLAGDVLHPGDPRGIVALGFIACGPWDFVGHTELREGTVDKAITRSLDRDDMLSTAMSTFTSLTVHCARCHDHKFDPIPQEDYYRLQAVFAGVERADRPYDPDPEVHRRRRALLAEKARLEALAPLPPAKPGASPTDGYHSVIEARPEVEKWVQVDLGASEPIDLVRLVPARPTDFPDTPGFGFPPRFRVEASDDPAPGARAVLADHSASDFPGPGDRPVEVQAGGRRARYIRVTATRLRERTRDFIFALAELEVVSGGRNIASGRPVSALDSIEAGRWSRSHLVDGFSSRARLAAAEALPEGAGAGARAALERLAAVEGEIAALPPPRLVYAAASEFVPVGTFSPPGGPRPIHLLKRGDVKSPEKPVGPGALSCLEGLEAEFRLEKPGDEASRRAALARWIADRRNPLTWRSIVNRVWHHHFGRGLVDTPNDFGRMGSEPSHPELLDWLAAWFQEDGGSLKRLHRLLVTSAVYRQSSREDPRAVRIDPENRLLGRMSRRRLDAESVRDAALFLGGALELTMGGPPDDHFAFKDDHSPVYDYAGFDGESPAARRRSIYRTIVRSVPDPLMECLDCADPSLLTPKRNTTLTALQALAMLNNPFMVREAGRLAARVRGARGDLRGRVAYGFELALGRPPEAEEAALLAAHAGEHGLENACRLLLNANEFLFVD